MFCLRVVYLAHRTHGISVGSMRRSEGESYTYLYVWGRQHWPQTNIFERHLICVAKQAPSHIAIIYIIHITIIACSPRSCEPNKRVHHANFAHIPYHYIHKQPRNAVKHRIFGILHLFIVLRRALP